MKRQHHNQTRQSKRHVAPNGIRTVETRLHLNRVVRKEATLSVDSVSERKGPASTQHIPLLSLLSLRHGGMLLVTGVLLGRQSVLYLYFGRQLFYTVRLEEGEVNHGLEQRDDLLRVAGLPQEVALLQEERCKRRHKGDKSLLTAQRENAIFQNATEHLQAAAVSSGS